MSRSTSAPVSGSGAMVAWERRRVLSGALRIATVVVPVAVSVVVAWLLNGAVPVPDPISLVVLRWLGIAAASTLVIVACEWVARRAIPLAALLRLTLIFPDRAPSRFRVAMRTSTAGQLRRRIAEAQTGRVRTPAESAEHVLELIAALRVHDRLTRGHSERVRAYSQLIADNLPMSASDRDHLIWSSLLHDIGKLYVAPEILNKTTSLTDEEFKAIKLHPVRGRELVERLVPWLGDSAKAVWEHHERWDGGGYPAGLAGTEISLAARIVAVADAFDVMTSARSYKAPMSAADARVELARCAGTQFDPEIVRVFLSVSISNVRRVASPLSWVFQLALIPAKGSSTAGASLLTVTLAVASAAAGIELAGGARPSDRVEIRSSTTIDGAGGRSVEDEPDQTEPPVSTSGRADQAPDVESAPPTLPSTVPDLEVTTTTLTPVRIPPPMATTTTVPPPVLVPSNSAPETVSTVLAPVNSVLAPVNSILGPVNSVLAPVNSILGPVNSVLAPVNSILEPVITIPEITIPEITIPEITIPEITLRELTVPEITLPEITLPALPIFGG